jgi:hypothetical protein
MSDPRFDKTLVVAERAVAILAEEHVDALVIGALALAAHNYPRATDDLDLAIAVAPSELGRLAARFEAEGWSADVRTPDPSDPLGGVVDVRAPGADLVQVVNFDNSPAGGFPRLVRDALPRALPLGEGALRVVDLPMLIAFKLYAGGSKSALDVLELLARNDVDRGALHQRCADLGLAGALARVLALEAPRHER